MSKGVELIAAERQRQIEVEGWTAKHDAQHKREELVEAAICYAYAAEATQYGPNCVTFSDGYRAGEGVPRLWPWDDPYWKPSTDAIRNLVKAGALIAAEIDRLMAQKHQEGGGKNGG
ncbi:MAG TPA: hypothetical protein VGK74_02485 [Symbiobacteriaceae bacterium]|jgi:hypothetical protein